MAVYRSQPELNQLAIQEAIARWQRDPLDTGSSEVQVAIFTKRIEMLAAHLQRHHKDKSSKRALAILVSQRGRMLKYMRRKQRERYHAVIEGLGIRPTKQFDPTLVSHPHGTTTQWKVKGLNRYTPKKRRPRARPYGEAKNAKGRSRLVKHAVRQRRLLKKRKKAVDREAALAARQQSAAGQASAAKPTTPS